MKSICWVDDDESMCYWEKSWKQLYNNVCDFAREQGLLGELLDYLEIEEEEE